MSLKSWLIEKALRGELPDWIYRLIGKEISKKVHLQEGNAMETKHWYESKAVWTSIVGVILGAVQPISSAFGHPVVVPNWVLEVLAAFGVYSLRTGDKPIA